jgi:transmembrane sensor
MICTDRPLGEIVADLNRRYPTPIRLSARAAQQRFSGVLDLNDQPALVQRLAGYLSLTVHRTDREITLD